LERAGLLKNSGELLAAVQFTIGVKRGFEEVRVSIFKKASNSFGYSLSSPHLVDISNEFESSILPDKRFNQNQQQ
jgi:hypothetical protein